MTKNKTDTNPDLVTNLPSSGGGTGEGLTSPALGGEYGGYTQPPKYQKEPIGQVLKDNWHIILFLFAAIGFFIFQVLIPLEGLKQRVEFLEKSTEKNTNWIDEITKSNLLNSQQAKQSPTPTNNTTPETTEQ